MAKQNRAMHRIPLKLEIGDYVRIFGHDVFLEIFWRLLVFFIMFSCRSKGNITIFTFGVLCIMKNSLTGPIFSATQCSLFCILCYDLITVNNNKLFVSKIAELPDPKNCHYTIFSKRLVSKCLYMSKSGC